MESKVTIDDLAGMVKRRFDKVDETLDRIENYILRKHEREIGDLKLRMQNLEDMLAMPMRK